MRRFDLIDENENPTGELDEEAVRAIATREGWKQQREQRLLGSSDLIPTEIKLGAFRRRLDLQQMLSRMNNANARAFAQYQHILKRKHVIGRNTEKTAQISLLSLPVSGND